MKAHELFIPKESEIQAPEDEFRWNEGDNHIIGKFSRFKKIDLSVPIDDWRADIEMGKKYWRINGANNLSISEQPNFLGFLFLVPYLDENLMEETYEYEGDFGKGLQALILHTDDSGKLYANTQPDIAELTIRLDPRIGKVQGEFKVRYMSLDYHLEAAGTFKLTQSW